jgi:hypothetical protein
MHSCRSSSSCRQSRLGVAITALLIAAACSEPQFSLPTSSSNTDSTSTTETASATDPQTFSGTLDVRGRRFYSFTVPSTRTVWITLEQLQDGAGAPMTATVVLGLGIPSGTGCTMLREVAARASEVPHLDESLTAGVYCAQLTDPGSLPGAAAFSVRIEFP